MKQVNYRVIFNRTGKLNKDGKAVVQIEAYLNKRKKYFSTGIRITPKQWDKRRGLIKNHPNAQSLNWRIVEFLKKLQEFELEMIRTNGYFDLSMFEILKN